MIKQNPPQALIIKFYFKFFLKKKEMRYRISEEKMIFGKDLTNVYIFLKKKKKTEKIKER